MSKTDGFPNFRRGVTSLVILALLDQGDMYGYQLVQETERRSGGDLTTQEGSLYPVLYKLVDLGYISDRRVKVGRRMTRIYYHLEPSGKVYLEELTREYEAVTRGVMRIVEGKAEEYGKQSVADAVLCEGLEASALQQQTEKTDPSQNSCTGLGLSGAASEPVLC